MPFRQCLSSPRGWRKAAATNTIIVFLAAVLLIILLAVSWPKSAGIHGNVFIYQGDCGRSRVVDITLHLIINIVSSLVLASSNFFAQILSSPTRDEVDKIHASKRAIQIGNTSINTVFRISPIKTVLLVLFFLSSLPFHLFFNGSIFSTSYAGSDYRLTIASESFTNGAQYFLPKQFGQSPGNGSLHRQSYTSNQLLEVVLLANLPQLGLSPIYLAYNWSYTRLAIEKEWQAYGYYTSSEGNINAAVSGSGFADDVFIGLGFSGIALAFVGAVEIVMILTSLFIFYRKPNINMVVGGNNSLVISAACHVSSSSLSSPESGQRQQYRIIRPDEPDGEYEYEPRNVLTKNKLKSLIKRPLSSRNEDATNDDTEMRERLIGYGDTNTPQYIGNKSPDHKSGSSDITQGLLRWGVVDMPVDLHPDFDFVSGPIGHLAFCAPEQYLGEPVVGEMYT
ncbi:hypothetical protein PISL3812_08255 [Talaromyces islandicus]|uniref:DUF6536 domain-containing protein n=1 Tax=Talaromyces islandicus TaxID=28573 RepID=A0A0U1M6Q0_TALIS|nr:hypothetical protein PISL3812_08255 [Talaromyces islandicus]